MVGLVEVGSGFGFSFRFWGCRVDLGLDLDLALDGGLDEGLDEPRESERRAASTAS